MSYDRIHHTKIFVSDMERSIHFYRDLLKFELVYDAERSEVPAYDKCMGLESVHLKVAMLWYESEANSIGLIQFLHPDMNRWEPRITTAGFSTLAISVTDIDSEYERLKTAGVTSISDPVDIIRDGGRRTARCCYIHDPDGLPIELYEAFATLDKMK